MSAPISLLERVPSRTSARSRFGVDADDANYKWWALSCTSLGMLLAATNSGTLIIALPHLDRALHTRLLALVWVILAYLIAATVLFPSSRRLLHPFPPPPPYLA